ncbi:DUF4145 domain-containing protein [Pseudomonas sp. LSJ-87]|uniref:DUF4145 domain-containing protein n=1 Tax=Pseudomonas sp. LSJ-87 TaxID=3079932 RepID=UPI00294180EC|nr:DUF4145 domain-containing protein [Pseudomonas sp. LSJ-87]MDV5099616.1 DUF4145 domain-containing protein [Pseudomonas sp. LSJ-87]
MNKEILNRGFTKDSIFEYKCPHCYSAMLRPDGEFRSVETEESKSEHHEDWWEPEMIRLAFSTSLKCVGCKETVFVVGRGSVEEEIIPDDNGDWDRQYSEIYTPSYFHPPLQLIDYPAATPKEVILPLSTACELFFSSPAACCNSVRTAGEVILSHLGIPEKNGKSFIPFGNRVKLLSDGQKNVKELFHALKVLGNHGSHPGTEMVHDDAIHALEITEFILEEVYGTRRAEVQKLARVINARQSPLGRLYKWLLKNTDV